MTSSHVVVDASVVLRFALDGSSEARAVLVRGGLTAPAVLVPEAVNGLANQVRFGRMPVEDAAAALANVLELAIELVPDSGLASGALAVAASRDLTAYDALYLTLAERIEAPLVTADRRLAASYDRAELIA